MFEWLINRLFAFDGDGGGSGSSSGGGSGSGSGDGNPGGNGAGTPGGQGGGNGGQNQPFAVFPDEKSFMSRISREAKKQLEAQAKEMGFDSVEAMQAALKAAKEKADADKTEAQKLQEKLQAAEAERTRALATANDRLIRAEVKLQAAALGIVDPDAAYALMDRDDVKVDDKGNVAGVKEALEALLKAKPYLKGQAAAGKSGGEFNGGDNQPVFTREQLRKMSPDEINKNWAAISKQMEAGLIK